MPVVSPGCRLVARTSLIEASDNGASSSSIVLSLGTVVLHDTHELEVAKKWQRSFTHTKASIFKSISCMLPIVIVVVCSFDASHPVPQYPTHSVLAYSRVWQLALTIGLYLTFTTGKGAFLYSHAPWALIP